VLSEGLVSILDSISWTNADGTEQNLLKWIYLNIFARIDAAEFGSFLFAICYMLLCWAVCRYLYAKKIFIKL
jgi:predicted acyltransferase